MRHLRSIFYALVLAPVVWVLAGVGFTHDLSSRGRELFAAESISGLLLLIFSGILFAILTFAPISPAGPVLAGAAYLGVTIWAFNAPEAYARLWAPEVSKEGFDLSRPGYGLAALLAIPLLVTALSARRWARYEPPVLPIIGEIGLFRGKAQVPGIPMSIAETTVLRAGRPLASDPPASDQTVAMSTAADQTVAIPTAAAVAAAAETVASPAAAVSAPVATAPSSSATASPATPAPADSSPASTSAAASPAGASPAGGAPASASPGGGAPASASPGGGAPASASSSAKTDPDAGRAWDPTIAVRSPNEEQRTVYVVSSDETTSATVGRTVSNKSGIAADPAAEKAGEDSSDEETERLPRPTAEPSRGNAAPSVPAADATQPVPTTAAPEPIPASDATQVLPTTAATKPKIARAGTVTPPSDSTEPIKLPIPDDATALIPAQRRPPAIES